MRKFFFVTVLLALFTLPLSVLAISNVFDAESWVISVLGRIGYFLWILSLAAFFWGLVKFISNTHDSAAHEKGKHIMIWGIASFFVLISLWGIVGLLLGDTFGFSPSTVIYVDKNGAAL